MKSSMDQGPKNKTVECPPVNTTHILHSFFENLGMIVEEVSKECKIQELWTTTRKSCCLSRAGKLYEFKVVETVCPRLVQALLQETPTLRRIWSPSSSFRDTGN